MAHWFRNMRIRRRMHEVFRLPLPCDPRLAENRFSEARETARALYRRIVQAAPTPPGFVHPQWEENIREVESYFLERFDMSFMAYPRINSTMVFTKHAAHEAEWPSVEAWRSPDTVQKYLRNGLNDHFLTGKIGIGTLINSTHQLYHLACFERFRGEQIEQVRSVVEFGGGYGNLARLFRCFEGLSRYAIVDLPLFSCIQYVFLSTVLGPGGVRLVTEPRTPSADGIVDLVPINLLTDLPRDGELFVSTWALSECLPAAYDLVRERDWFGAREILLAFHDGWKPWSTEEMIGGLRERFGRVETVPLHFLPGNHYLQATGRIAPGGNG
ncbi:hypothetical protein [Candidatus Deferrimicrobium sp.]|uniref:hypothetical protein n=1 Tax=Candidatus Deferrimicrobium sp. TaxID=3060586 RepID=UPI002ED15567